MNLDFVNNILDILKENNFVQNFIKELTDYLKDKNNFKINNQEVPIIEDILSKNKVTIANGRAIKWKLDEVILEFAKQNFPNDIMCFIKDNKKTYWSNNEKLYYNDVYSVIKVENSKLKEIEISKSDMPTNIKVNDVFVIEDGRYIKNNIATNDLQEEIIIMANEIINKQNENINSYRKEGHLYMVTEDLGKKIFLLDLTENTKIEFEEVDISRELLDNIAEGAVLKFVNGKYEFYSNDGFERIEKIDE